MREVDAALDGVHADPRDGALVAVVRVGDAGLGAVPARRVRRPLLAAHDEIVHVGMRKVQTGDRHRLRLHPVQVERLLGLTQHVQRPGAQPPVRRDADQVVRVLGTHHAHAVHRVLPPEKKNKKIPAWMPWISDLTVCADADSGVLCMGVLFWTRLSHRTICPE